MNLGALTEEARELVEGKALPVGSFVNRKGGTYRKMRDGKWSKVRKTKVKAEPARKKSKAKGKTGIPAHLKARVAAMAKSLVP